eukprot:2359785-Pyramimonas_sp.AAC.1
MTPGPQVNSQKPGAGNAKRSRTATVSTTPSWTAWIADRARLGDRSRHPPLQVHARRARWSRRRSRRQR